MSALAETLLLVDAIPSALSAEAEQNSEPSIAVNPANPSQILIGSFDNASPNPYFLSTDGGMAWSQLTTLRHADETLEWSAGGTAYTSRALDTGGGFDVLKT